MNLHLVVPTVLTMPYGIQGHGNSGRHEDDYVRVSCEIFREALSARVDSEQGPLPDDQVDQHLATCQACRTWYERSQRLRRSMLLRSAPEVPDLTAVILENSPPPSREKWGLRVALAMVGLVQCGLAFAQLLGTETGLHGGHGGAGAEHLLNEGAAWNLAIGIGLLWAALRTRAAAGQLPMITGFVLVLSAVSASDLINGQVSATRLVTHVFLVVGLALLFAVYRQHRARLRPDPLVGDALGTDEWAEPAVEGTLALAPDHEESRPVRRRPTGRHAA
ncbi:Predicted anti-sigma-YlaC factor YlaD, contains Zn-finger domain [Amycolatopsis xylanica]|uniref:Predicted anti-sigma-YlaC factor YlaD, contains Zn-finger domain n=1 Tax=Amycolatopsis xylanica TaxID=589385 RepID=A0A1H2W2D8_9PSEU|nr:zf-HC2 domain-containing protein [Amycolatopsis xylanica]SDW74249.1 Predicted anti-sigma-YlaC factor YlaD, contains Zn-finger domain [Amycolatopsis xylanica]